jgi:hypothetical protein
MLKTLGPRDTKDHWSIELFELIPSGPIRGISNLDNQAFVGFGEFWQDRLHWVLSYLIQLERVSDRGVKKNFPSGFQRKEF